MRGERYFGVLVLLVGALLIAPLLGSAPAQRPGNTFDCVYFDRANSDARICRVAANSLAMQWGTNAQTFSIYETFTSTSNYESMVLDSASNKARIYTKDDGTNGTAAALQFGVDSTLSWEITTSDDFVALGAYDLQAEELRIVNTAEGGTGAFTRLTAREVHTLAAASTSDTTTITIPAGAKVHGCSFVVNTTVVDSAGDDTWSAAFITGDTSTLATAGAAAAGTKVNTMVVDAITTDATQVQFTAQGGSFSAGVIEVVCYYETFTSLGN